MKKYSKTPNLLIDGYVPYSPCRACYIEDILKIVLRDSRTYVHTATFKMENQQGPTVEHRELCSVLCGSLDWEGGLRGEWIRVYVWLSPFTIHLKLSQHCQ